MNRLIATACILGIATLTACSQKAGTTADAKKSDNVAVVDGVPITRQTYDEYVKVAAKNPAELTQEQRDTLLENLVRAQVLAKEAQTNGVAKDVKVVTSLELQRLNILTQAMTENYLKDRKATEAELRAEYDRQVAGMDKVQYRASHILVPSEEAAKQIIAQLKAGADFADIAKKVSLDSGSKEKGGDLDWFTVTTMAQPFAIAVQTLKKGETTAAPVKTDFGWHVIRLTDSRPAVAPPYESVKDRLANPVEGKKFKDYVDGLVGKAKVTKSL